MLSIVEVQLKDGRSFVQHSAEKYRGGPENPFTMDELRAKFTDCAQLTLTAPAIARSLELIETVEKLKNTSELVDAMTSA